MSLRSTEALALALSLVLPSSHLPLVPLALGFALWIVPDMRIVHLLDFLADADAEGGPDTDAGGAPEAARQRRRPRVAASADPRLPPT